MFGVIYSEFIRALLRIVEKLNLTMAPQSEILASRSSIRTSAVTATPSTFSDKSSADIFGKNSTTPRESSTPNFGGPDNGMADGDTPIPVVPKDFQIFSGFCEFIQHLLPVLEWTYLSPWIYMLCQELITKAAKSPKVGGCYVLIQSVMEICKHNDYFKGVLLPSADIELTGPVSTELIERGLCLELVVKFIREVLVGVRQYKDSLLTSCLLLVLNLPAEIITLDISCMVPPLAQALTLGRGYLSLAAAAMDVIEQCFAQVPTDELSDYYAILLPCIDTYLNVSNREFSDDNTDKTSSAHGKKKKSTTTRDWDTVHELSGIYSLGDIRVRMVKLLGSLDGDISNLVVERPIDNNSTPEWVAWDSVKHLPFHFPFRDMKPIITLDLLLPRIILLATVGSDRQVKVSACEALHSAVIVMVGKQTTAGSKSIGVLYAHVFPAVLALAIDTEIVARQLFEPLVQQLIHWFTRNKQYESEETVVLLNAIMDGIASEDARVKDFSAYCIAEFFRWSIKGATKEQLEKSPLNIKSLFKRLYSLALHPSVGKRLGAAQAFLKIYTIFRTHSSLVDQFIFEMIDIVMQSLQLSHLDSPLLGTQNQIALVLTKLTCIVVNVNGLQAHSKNRRIPVSWSALGLPGDTGGLLAWLFNTKVGCLETAARHAAWEMFGAVAAVSSGAKSWMQHKLASPKGESLLRAAFEIGNDVRPDPASRLDVIRWFSYCEAMFDGYGVVFGSHFVKVSDVLPRNNSQRSTLTWSSVTHFVDNFFAIKDMGVTPAEKSKFNEQKCTLVLRILHFLGVVASNDAAAFPQDFLTDRVFEMVLICVLDPGSVGFDMNDSKTVTALPQQTGDVLNRLVHSSHRVSLLDVAFRLLGSSSFDILVLLEQLQKSFRDVSSLVTGYEQLLAAELLIPVLSKRNVLPVTVSQCIFSFLVTEQTISLANSPIARGHLTRLMDLALLLQLPVATLLTALLNNTVIHVARRKVVNAMDEDNSEDEGQGLGTTTVAKNVCSNTSTLGQTFYRIFSSPLNGYVVRNFAVLAKGLFKHAREGAAVQLLLEGALQACHTDGQLRSCVKIFMEVFLEQWPMLSSWWSLGTSNPESRANVLKFVTLLTHLDHTGAIIFPHAAFPSMFDMYIQTLEVTAASAVISLSDANAALDLLKFFSKMPEPRNGIVVGAVDQIVRGCFPLRSDEYPEGSIRRRDYLRALNYILEAMVTSGNAGLLLIVQTLLCREKEQHIHECVITDALIRYIKSPASDQSLSLQRCFDSFFFNSSTVVHQVSFRKRILEKVLVVLLQACALDRIRGFFENNIKVIMGVVTARAVSSSASGGAELIDQLIVKGCIFYLLEIMYQRLPLSDVSGPSSRINSAYCTGVNIPVSEKGNELTKEICSKNGVHAALRETCLSGSSEPITEVRRIYHCWAFRCMIALITRTQTDEKFFTAFLFKENADKAERLLDNLIDPDRVYEFSLIRDAPTLTRKKRMDMLRADSSRGRGVGIMGKYMSSQLLAGSSLSDDIGTTDDFSEDIKTDEHDPNNNAMDIDNQDGSFAEGVTENQSVTAYSLSDDDLELDDLNNHEIMAPLLGVMDVLVRLKPLPRDPFTHVLLVSPESSMPNWIVQLKAKIEALDTCLNVRLIIGKIISNKPDYFKPWASSWFRPILLLLLSLEKICSNGIAYYITDLVVVMLSWGVPSMADANLVGKLLGFLVAHARHEETAVLKNNINIIKILIEKWKPLLESSIPYMTIFKNFSSPEYSPEKWALPGIHLLSVVIANDLPPFDVHNTIIKDGTLSLDRAKYYQQLVLNLSKASFVYRATAVTLGMALRYLFKKPSAIDEFSLLRDLTKDKLNAMLHQKQPDVDRFLVCLTNICDEDLGFPRMAEPFFVEVLHRLQSLHGIFKNHALNIIKWQATGISNLFTELRGKDLLGMLRHRDQSIQLIILDILINLAPNTTILQMEYYLEESINTFTSSTNLGCRVKFYELVTFLYDHKLQPPPSDQPSFLDEDEEKTRKRLIDLVRLSLVRGLADGDVNIRSMLSKFWNHETRLSTGTTNRLLQIFQNIFVPGEESLFLQSGAMLMLDLCSLSADYTLALFDTPLEECDFVDIQIDADWRNRNQRMAPLFEATQLSTMSDTQSSQQGLAGRGMVRATMDGGGSLVYDPTQADSGAAIHRSFLSGGSQSASFGGLSQKPGLASQSLYFINRPKGATDSFSGTFSASQDAQQIVKRQNFIAANELKHLKQRFLKSSQTTHQTHQYFARQAINRKENAKANQLRSKDRRANEVTMFRKYRAGELPDIQIKYSELIIPIQALCRKDCTFARLFLTSLFQGVIAHVRGGSLSGPQADEIKLQFITQFTTILELSVTPFSPFISCVQDICRVVGGTDIPARTVSGASRASQSCPTGILLLEQQLMADNASSACVSSAPKRARTAKTVVQSPKVDQWIELASLYKEIGELDVLLGIFATEIPSSAFVGKLNPIDMEAERQYHAAYERYEELLDSDPDDFTKGEQQFLETAMVSCGRQLGVWDKTYVVLLTSIKPGTEFADISVKEIWNDNAYSERMLGSYVECLAMNACLGIDAPPLVTASHRTWKQELLYFVEDANSNVQHREFLENRALQFLPGLYAGQSELDRSKVYLIKCIDQFLSRWASVHPLMTATRRALIQYLQPIQVWRLASIVVHTHHALHYYLYEFVHTYTHTYICVSKN